MLRLILLMAFITVLAIAIMAVLGTIRALAPASQGKDTMPTTFRRTAYVVLIVLLLGVTSGWLGAA